MARFRNTRTDDVITVAGPLVDTYERKAHWERLDKSPAPAGKKTAAKKTAAKKTAAKTASVTSSTRRRG